MLRSISLAVAGALTAVSVVGFAAHAQDAMSGAASDDPIQSRQAIMESFGASAKVGGGMIKGEIPYNPAVGQLVLATLDAGAHTFGHYFPEGSDTGDTEASPKIWQDMDGFHAKIGDLQQATAAAVKAKPQDLDAFKATFGKVAKNCKSCHEDYRVKKD
ncbi:cytochrome c556 [Rhodopseudomonas julia]|uniref:Cytochrome c556 n=1 Tax=Rhodopseudomonas julia TaxID=200617 RepID=A0ABU0C3P8_9BRAD|nr:cytochrome c [Rhodopseudomonas julia]MDQ0324594.1 cytochrome c556 [Rhodopseudomonas julia]